MKLFPIYLFNVLLIFGIIIDVAIPSPFLTTIGSISSSSALSSSASSSASLSTFSNNDSSSTPPTLPNTNLEDQNHNNDSINIEELKTKLKIGIVTWNLAERSPSLEDCRYLQELQQQSCDLIILGIQECENIKPRRHEGRRSQKWRELMSKTLLSRKKSISSSSSSSSSYELFAHHKFGGMQLTVFMNQKAKELIDGIQTIEVACGIGNVLSNKGAIVMLIRIQGKTIAFINSHLAAHHNQVKARNADYHRIVETVVEKAHRKWIYFIKSDSKSPSAKTQQKIDVSPSFLKSKTNSVLKNVSNSKKISSQVKSSHRLPSLPSYRKNKKKKSVLSLAKEKVKAKPKKLLSELFDLIFFFGDLNYRIELPRLEIESFCETYATTEEIEIFRPSPHPSSQLSNPGGNVNKRRPLLIRRKILSPNKPASNSESNPYYLNFHEDLEELLLYDQLIAQIYAKKAFENFQEGKILFPPSFKYDKNSDVFDTSAKGRCPAWTDRILYSVRKPLSSFVLSEKTPENVVEVKEYYSVDVRSSDHRPVCGVYTTQV